MVKALAGLFLLILLFNPFTLAWLASRYVVDDGLHPSDVVVALRGDNAEENRRINEALRVFPVVNARIMLMDVNAVPFFEVPQAQILRAYLKRKGLSDSQLEECPNTADSTEEEARALRSCFQRTGARQVTVVTSEYHTRRAAKLLRRELAGTGITVRMHPVYNSDYWDVHWWRKRRWAKTFFLETAKIIWTALSQW
ncbi:MAG: YdcF family protein [Acidobacteria bacterium]|nr:YdcF family protein [Acidobacteriota bacterium]